MMRSDSTFRPTASGLLVPQELSRVREVWTKDEVRLLDRVRLLLVRHQIDLYLGCQDRDCRKQGPIERFRTIDGGMTLRCAHKDRVLQGAF